MPRVTFYPAGVTVEVAPGTSVLEAAREADLPIRNDCGGQGACGRCLIELRRGEVARLPSRHSPPEGRDLACRTQVQKSPVEVFLPEESHEVDLDVSLRPAEALPLDYSAAQGLVEQVELDLPPPTLDDNTADAERLRRGLREWREGHYMLDYDVLGDLPARLRRADWQPCVTLAAENDAWRVVHAECGPPSPRHMLAVDIGTTTVKARLVCPGGRHTASCYNAQVMYGPDVISRIMHCERDEERGCRRLQELVVEDVQRLLESLLDDCGVEATDVWGVVCAGNTTMMHLFLGMEPGWIRREPYVGCCYAPPPLPAAGLGLRLHPAARVYAMPSVSSYVGADIASGVLATGLHEMDDPAALIDLGTNGEIVVGCREFMVCCSASAGPAFEGGASASGTRAREGAVDSVWADGRVRWKTIGDAPPVGICGTGYIDLLATAVRESIIDKTGSFVPDADGVREAENGSLEYVLVPVEKSATGEDIVLTKADVDNLVRAKGAIFAAGRILLGSLGMEWSDLETIMLAGGFGERLDRDNAVTIGLLPDVPRERIRFVGNSSLRGAVMAAQSAEHYHRAREIAGAMTYFELSTHPDFMDEFVSACFLPHTDAEEFPSVSAVPQ